ncbi:anti-sigma factor [Shewanella sp.]|uniref:anti-sigma factor n=1 Tax=Shewanella sp. TaxID=50422 RepID=UPI00260A7415|nr:anti-sigma factor [Shewanella sp.]
MTLTPRSREEQLEQLVAKAPKDLAPERDLWLTIEKRMDKPLSPKADVSKHSRPLWPQWAMAAAILLAVFFGYQYQGITPTTQNTAQQAPKDSDKALQTLLTQIATMHQGQVDALEHTPNALIWQTRHLSAPLEQGLEELRRAGAQIYQALQANPTDKQLWQLWLWVQQRELELLQQGQKLPIKNSTQGNTL